MRKLIVIAVLCQFEFGCTKERNTEVIAYLKNNTTHSIKIYPFFSGIVPPDKILNLPANGTIEIAHSTERGLVNNGGFSSKYFNGSDSTIVIFDDRYSITHYFMVPQSRSSKYYLFSSIRNLNNLQSFQYSSNDVSKNFKKNTYLYEFVEQDFLDAR